MMSDSPHHESKSSKPGSGGRRLAIQAAVVLLIAAAVGLWFLWQAWRGPVDLRITPAEAARLERLKDAALAYLENEDFAEADVRFAEIAAKLPSEPLGRRNLAICRMLWLKGKTKPDPAQVKAAVDALARAEPNSPLAHLLLARWELREESGITFEAAEARLQLAAAEYHKAAELEPDNPAPRYEFFERVKDSSNKELVAQGQAALGQARQLAPDNFWALKDWLVIQAQLKDAAIEESLAMAKSLFRPVREQGVRRKGLDVEQHLDEAAQALKQQKWGDVQAAIFRVNTAIYWDDVLKSDHRRLVPHLLELADYEFSPRFRKLLAKPTGPRVSDSLSAFRHDGRRSPQGPLNNVHAVAIADFDLNTTADLLVLRDQELLVLGRAEAADAWSELARAEIPPGYSLLLVADLDDDEDRNAVDKRGPDELPAPAGRVVSAETYSTADVDVVLYGEAGLLLLRNQRQTETGRRTLEPVALPAGLSELKQVTACVLVDFYHDGDLDLVVASQQGVSLWTNQGNMQFGDLSKFSTLPPAGVVLTSLVAVDWDRDADIDIVASGPAPNSLGWLENLRHGQFRWRRFEAEYNDLDQSRSLAVLEADGNASWDLVGAGESGVQAAFTAGPALGVTRHVRTDQLSQAPANGVLVFDYDNDGWPDLLVYREDSVRLFRGGDGGTFEAVTGQITPTPKEVVDCAVGDLDNDGDLDVVVASSSGIALYDNEVGSKNHWLRVHLRGGRDPQGLSNGRVNHNGVGSLVEVKAGGLYQAQVATGQTLHFGLGQNEAAEVARIVWTNGLPQAAIGPKGNQVLEEKLILKGSCPYLYLWTGERYEFFTDCLWAAPLGLQFGEGNLAPSREWEYLKIPGERMALKNDRHSLQITEELWEAAYFDQVELLAVDHPAEVEIYSNEKVGPAEIAQLKVHTARAPRSPVAARDKHGRDVLPQINSRDGDFFRGFDARVMQGLTDEHFLELDLGRLENPTQLTLFLTGWIYPTDTSLNVGIGENPALRLPRPPYILVPNAQGEWQEARPYMGFPGGKTKTIAVDLTGLFPANDYRLRIATSAEIYWDEAFFTVNEEPTPTKITPLKLVSADLHYRGFSAAYPRRANVPDTYDYAAVSTEPRWPPMRGMFTRYGDVRDLLTATDDLHVILSSGDELTLEFEPLADPPAGWKRDYFIHNVGWDKDADLNTVFGQTVEPLPFAAMKSYPFQPGENYPDSPRHRRYLETYQTREQPAAPFWKQLRQP